jgi:hypothetical protein
MIEETLTELHDRVERRICAAAANRLVLEVVKGALRDMPLEDCK